MLHSTFLNFKANDDLNNFFIKLKFQEILNFLKNSNSVLQIKVKFNRIFVCIFKYYFLGLKMNKEVMFIWLEDNWLCSKEVATEQ